MENKSHAIAAGTFVLVLAAMAAGLAIWLKADGPAQRVYEMSSREGVSGLQPQANVRYKGVSVGRVTGIELDQKTVGNVLVRIAVNEQAPITQSTFATLGYQGVTGLAFIQLDDAGESSHALATSKESVGRIPMRAGLMARLADQGASLLNQLEQASQRVNGLLAADNQKSLMAAINNLGQAASHISTLSQRAEQVLTPPAGSAPLNLPLMAEQVGTTIQALQATSERVSVSADAIRTSADEFKRLSLRMNQPGGTLDNIEAASDTLAVTAQSLNANLVPRLNRAADEAATTARRIGGLAQTVNENPQALILGRGTALPGPGESGFVAPPAR